MRQGLNVESGLNDEICVPLFFVVLAIAQAQAGEVSDVAAFRLVAEEIGFGILGGVVAGTLAVVVVVLAGRRDLIESTWLRRVTLAVRASAGRRPAGAGTLSQPRRGGRAVECGGLENRCPS